MAFMRFFRGKVVPTLRVFVILQFLVGLFVLMIRNYQCEDQVKKVRRELDAARLSKIVPIKADEKGAISLPLAHYKKIYPFGTQPNEDNLLITITGWTMKETNKKKWFNEGETDFLNCPNLDPWMRCSYSSNRASLNYSKAVLFHGRYIDADDMPTSRHSRQKWVFYENESPPTTAESVDLHQYRDLFNITSTYTMDSNVPLLFRKYICQPRTDPMPEKTNYALNKKGVAVWFSQDCETQSKREVYVEALSKYMKIDTFGKCGKAKCIPTEEDDGENCMKEVINAEYKFYLAFEDSLCQEFVTEQLFRLLSLNVIPIVMTSEEVGNILPTGSYIDVRDYSSPKELAEHLAYIDKNDEVYNKYINNKMSVKCRHPQAFTLSCQLCRYLHINRYNREMVFDVAKFWNPEHRCTKAPEFYKKIADGVVGLDVKSPITQKATATRKLEEKETKEEEEETNEDEEPADEDEKLSDEEEVEEENKERELEEEVEKPSVVLRPAAPAPAKSRSVVAVQRSRK